MCIAISYVRWSHPDQSTGDSKRRQSEDYTKFCDSHKLTPSPTTYLDAGISARLGKNKDKGALGVFIKAVEQGKIPKGSVLVVEQLDRLSRLDLDQSLALFGQILRAGINIGHVRKNRILTKDDLKGFGVTEFAIELILAAEESQKKSERVGRAWQAKLANASEKIVTARCPCWLKLNKGKWEVIEKKAAIIRQIFALAIEGYGIEAICRRFNTDKIPPISKATTWQKGYVLKILTGRLVLGEAFNCQYYPAVIDNDTYYQAQAAINSRKHKHHGPRSKSCNPLQGLVKDAVSGSTMYTITRATGQKQLVPSAAIERDAKYWSISLQAVLYAVLAVVTETQIEPTKVQDNRLNSLQAKLEGIAGKINATIKAVDKTPNIDSLLVLLAKLEQEKDKVSDQIETVKAELANKVEDTVAGIKWAWQELKKRKADERQALLTSLGSKLRSLIDRVELERQGGGYIGKVFYKSGKSVEFFGLADIPYEEINM